MFEVYIKNITKGRRGEEEEEEEDQLGFGVLIHCAVCNVHCAVRQIPRGECYQGEIDREKTLHETLLGWSVGS